MSSALDASGSWELPEELRMLRDTLRRFMAEEVRPAEDKLPHDAYTLEPGPLKALQARARDVGLWLFETPAEHGGAGLSLLGQCGACGGDGGRCIARARECDACGHGGGGCAHGVLSARGIRLRRACSGLLHTP